MMCENFAQDANPDPSLRQAHVKDSSGTQHVVARTLRRAEAVSSIWPHGRHRGGVVHTGGFASDANMPWSI